MLKHFISYFLLMVFAVNSFAAPIGNAKDISGIMMKYDYLLSSHPQAHEKSFKDSSLVKFKKELEAAVLENSKEENELEFREILQNIPTQEDRDAYLKVLKNSSKTQIVAMLADPKLLEASIRGESANFFVKGKPLINTAIILVAALLIYAIVMNVIENGKWQRFQSSSSVRAGTCETTWVPDHELDAIIEDARSKCETQANHPETCKSNGFNYFSDTQYSDNYPYNSTTNCKIYAEYKALVKLD